ncbi:hypothetical protein [Methylorubrum extorquens]|uniref:Uncharacterized protein n=1 Tax=Methylorubrum extorquens (strain CM4 / NCIMB 13688) TaxID=440085 RepID=B7KST6_METC4|nr:hypothetical protein [Methylorubrum extorquens]ACK82438.1 hypothetical protein Mchl_1574 [Methylorubrum extorquens CM4]
MAEIRLITPKEAPSPDQSHVLIAPAPDGRFIARGSVSSDRDGTFWDPQPFDTVEAAIADAQAWAKQNDVPHIFVRERA